MKIPLQCKTAREHPQKPHPHRSKAGSSQGSPQLEAREAGGDAVTAGYSLVAKGTNFQATTCVSQFSLLSEWNFFPIFVFHLCSMTCP